MTSSARTTRRLIGRLHPPGGHGIERGQPGMEVGHLDPALGQLVLEGRLDLGIAAGELQVVDDGPQVEAGAPHQQGVVAPGGNAAQRLPGRLLELGDGELLVGIDQIEQVVRHLGLLGQGRLRRAHVHAPVDAHGVHRHDLDIAPPPGHLEGRLRLPRRGDAEEGDDGQALASGIRTRCRGRAVTSSSRPER